jgi:hypothetical protein
MLDHSLKQRSPSASLFNPKPQAPVVSGQQSQAKTAVACGSGLNEFARFASPKAKQVTD